MKRCAAVVTAGKPMLGTKPLGRTAEGAKRMVETVEPGVVGRYTEDVAYTPKSLKAVNAVRDGARGDLIWVRSRQTCRLRRLAAEDVH